MMVMALLLGIGQASGASADETWTLADSPNVIAVDTTIPAGVTVTIEPGVVVQMQQGAPFHDDLDEPAPGTGFYYLVAATNDCGSGPWGPLGQTRVSACP